MEADKLHRKAGDRFKDALENFQCGRLTRLEHVLQQAEVRLAKAAVELARFAVVAPPAQNDSALGTYCEGPIYFEIETVITPKVRNSPVATRRVKEIEHLGKLAPR